MTSVRPATHAGSWYYGNSTRLHKQIDGFLHSATESSIPGARFLIGPHAGYSYAGETLAKTYKAWDVKNARRVFIIGPSHHVYFRGAQLTTFSAYATPFGNVPVDTQTVNELAESGLFGKMSTSTDEDEHSFELHMPMLAKVCIEASRDPVPIIPILVCSASHSFQRQLGQLLAPYLEDPENTFVVSTDFCHWGTRFDYTKYTDTSDLNSLRSLTRISAVSTPIYKSIEFLDKSAMKILSSGNVAEFQAYLAQTENTICGASPLCILLEAGDNNLNFKWLAYAQSSKVTDVSDSSVSYVAGYSL